MTLPYHYKRTRAPKGVTAMRDNPEERLQKAVVQFLSYCLPEDVEYTASLAGAHLGQSQRAKASATGLMPGWPDLMFVIARRTYYIEIKAPITVKSRNPDRYGTLDDPDLSADQRRVLGRLHPDCWRICRSVDEVAAALMAFGCQLKAHPFL